MKPRTVAQDAFGFICAIDRHDLPVRFRGYTQDQLNSAYVEKPYTRDNFKTQMSQLQGTPVEILDTGRSRLDSSVAYWALATYSEISGGWTYRFKTKTYLTQTPGYAWTVTCMAGNATGSPDTLYKRALPIFDAFFASIRFRDPTFR